MKCIAYIHKINFNLYMVIIKNIESGRSNRLRLFGVIYHIMGKTKGRFPSEGKFVRHSSDGSVLIVQHWCYYTRELGGTTWRLQVSKCLQPVAGNRSTQLFLNSSLIIVGATNLLNQFNRLSLSKINTALYFGTVSVYFWCQSLRKGTS